MAETTRPVWIAILRTESRANPCDTVALSYALQDVTCELQQIATDHNDPRRRQVSGAHQIKTTVSVRATEVLSPSLTAVTCQRYSSLEHVFYARELHWSRAWIPERGIQLLAMRASSDMTRRRIAPNMLLVQISSALGRGVGPW